MAQGRTSPELLRRSLLRVLHGVDAKVDDWWAATAAGHDLYGPAEDALIQLGADTRSTRLRDVAPDGSHLDTPHERLTVPHVMRDALARQGTSRSRRRASANATRRRSSSCEAFLAPDWLKKATVPASADAIAAARSRFSSAYFAFVDGSVALSIALLRISARSESAMEVRRRNSRGHRPWAPC
jgi:hypothetical protein